MSSSKYLSPPQPPLAFNHTVESIKESVKRICETTKSVLDNLVATVKPEDATFANVILPIVEREDENIVAISVLETYQKVSNDAALRAASAEASTEYSHFGIDSGARRDVFRLVDAVWRRNEELDPESKKLVREMRRDYVRNGLALESEADRERLKEIRKRLSTIATEYGRNIDEDTECLYFTPEELDGVSEDALAQLPRGSGENEGKYGVTHKTTHYVPVFSQAHSAETRKRLSNSRELQCEENVTLFQETVRLRDEAARLLGYPNHAAYTLELNMAGTPEAVKALLDDLVARSNRHKNADIAGLRELKRATLEAKDLPFDGELYEWDVGYYGKLMMTQQHDFDSAALAEYFPLQPTVAAMLDLFGDLFGFVFTRVAPADRAGLSPTGRGDDLLWHPDVLMYTVWNADDVLDGSFVGYLYLDLHPRDGKYSHAQCHAVQLGFYRPAAPDGTPDRVSYPSTSLLANFTAPAAGRPSLLRHGEVTMLFHELGHGVHDLAGRSRYARFFGASTVGDFNEAPSQMLENWCRIPEGLRLFSGHYLTGEKLPQDKTEKLLALRHVNAATSLLRQLRMCLFDLVVHWERGADVQEVYDRYRDLEGFVGDKSIPRHGFSSSMFRWVVEGSGVSYYGYYWSNVTAMDFFDAAFKKNPFDGEVGRRYRRTVLEKGASQDEMITAKQFLGREPKSDAFFEDLRFD